MDDVLKRLGTVETLISELRSQISAVLAVIPQLATKADVADVRAAVIAVEAVIPQMATKADVAAVRVSVATVEAVIPQLATKADVATMEAAIIKWIVATTLASSALAFAIAKFVH